MTDTPTAALPEPSGRGPDASGSSTGPSGRSPRRWAKPVAFGVAGLLAGVALAGTLSATAADSGGANSDSGSSATSGENPGGGDPTKSQPADEELLTGDVADKVREAALAEYPGATIERVETDSDGVYEAHLVTAEGERVTVEFDEDYAVTGTEAGGGRGGHGPGGHGHRHGPGDAATDGSTSSATSSASGT